MSRRLGGVCAGALAFVALATACGSRTGLFAPELVGASAIDAAADADAGGPTPVGCTPGQFDFELALTQLMFVVDRSGSMTFTLDGQPGFPRSEWRWTLLEQGLRDLILPFDDEIAMGAKFFPEPLTPRDLFDSELACRTDTGVAIPPRRGNTEAILGVFRQGVPRGGTPTAEAVRTAAQYLAASRGVARTLILATDGAPNCNGDLEPFTCVCTAQVDCAISPDRGRFSCLDDARTIGQIRVVFEEQRIPVYVIGLGSAERPEFRQVLDDMAVAGGRPRPTAPRHYSVQSRDDLEDALSTIRDSVARCTYLTPSAPLDPNAISVSVDGVPVARDLTKQNGWDWIDREYGELAFFGDACRLAQAGGARASVGGVVSCAPPSEVGR